MGLRKLTAKVRKPKPRPNARKTSRSEGELVVITGMSGSGKASVLKAFEDLGYYCVDNLPVGLIPRFAELVGTSSEIERTALVVDVREGVQLEKLPAIVKAVKHILPTRMIFLEASDAVLLRRFSETRRPHPLGTKSSVRSSLADERDRLDKIRAMADLVIDTSKFNVHELRAYVTQRFQKQASEKSILVSCVSFGFKQGVPEDADLMFDVRFLPNPHYDLRLRPLTGLDREVSDFVMQSPGTEEYLERLFPLLDFLFPRYAAEGKAHLTIGIGCTGGQHRSVAIAERVGKTYEKQGYYTIVRHRDIARD